MVIVTTDSDAYFCCILTTQLGEYVDLSNRHIKIKLSVRDEEYEAEYDTTITPNNFVNCVQDKCVCPYTLRSGKKYVPNDGEAFIYGEVDAIKIHVEKWVFSESAIMKVRVCDITQPDNNFSDTDQEMWSLIDTTTIKYKSYK
jgi:hypothetical protein